MVYNTFIFTVLSPRRTGLVRDNGDTGENALSFIRAGDGYRIKQLQAIGQVFYPYRGAVFLSVVISPANKKLLFRIPSRIGSHPATPNRYQSS